MDCLLGSLYTKNCVACGIQAKFWTGHVEKDGVAITAGWCSNKCEIGSSVPYHFSFPCMGHRGPWKPSMGAASYEEVAASKGKKQLTESPYFAVINDCICPTCGNDRCSTTESSCWKCGNFLHPQEKKVSP